MNVPPNAATAEPETQIHETKEALCQTVARALLDRVGLSLASEDLVHLGLTGGGAGIGVLTAAAELIRAGRSPELDWARVHFWWGDERLLPAGHPERNAQQADEALLDLLVSDHGLPQENVHRMPSSSQAETPAQGAGLYAETLASHAPPDGDRGALLMPKLTVLLLGVGPDGHIASLFPGRAALHATGGTTVGEDDSPKPPPWRVSLTFEAIHAAERVWLVVAGSDKASAVRHAEQDTADVSEIPAKNARGATETLWHVDRSAAGQA